MEMGISEAASAKEPVYDVAVPGKRVEKITLQSIFIAYKWRILLTYLLFTAEFLLFLLQPYLLGDAIDGLIKGEFRGVIIMSVLHLVWLGIGTIRRVNDTRTFSTIYNHTAVKLVQVLQQKAVSKSIMIARVNLSKELINFYENDVKNMFYALYSVAGSLIVLGIYDSFLFLFWVGLFVPELIINYFYSRKVSVYSREMNDQTEKEVAILERGILNDVRQHFFLLAKWRIKASNADALNFALIEFFILGMLVVSMVYYCSLGGRTAGEILAVFQYIMRLIYGMDYVPMLIAKINKVKDIQRRVREAFD